MIQPQLLEDKRIVTIQIIDKLTKEDFDSLAALVDPFIQKHGELKGILINVATTPGWEDFAGFVSHMKFVKDHHRHVAKIAAVGDSAFLKIAPKIASHFVHAQLKHFPADQKSQAMAWLQQ